MRTCARALAFGTLLAGCGSDATRGPDAHADATTQAGFGRPCTSDEQCEAKACVPHIGDTVCTQRCDPDTPCPDEWTCWTPPGGATAEARAICVSPFWSLCRPCSADADCASVADAEPGSCIDYNGSGTFCGSECVSAADCPDGFGCNEVRTRSGKIVSQCVNNAGMCECNAYISALGEATRCAVENDWGRCPGERTCDSKLWSRCDAHTPAPDAPNQLDDDCDGLTDELVCLCGDRVCDGACGETLANCPCDCAAQGDGVCSPCGESPSTSPVDCCRGPGGTAGCGDGFCMGFGCGENPATCPQDCSTPCGNSLCEPGESPFSCAEDCKHEVCGNNVCESSDGGPEACPQDCDAYCGDCECEAVRDESVFNCAIDCGYCGDGSCSACAVLGEDATTCAVDCCRPSPEACNGVDDDCDGATDEPDAVGCRPFYRDEDGDGLGRWDDARCLCAASGAWTAALLGDCDDADRVIGLGEGESCNERDDDCDGMTDEDFDLGATCVAPSGLCVSGLRACDGPDRTACVNGPPLPRGTICGALTCAEGIIQPPASCDGDGGCVPLPLVHCNGYMCDDTGHCDTHCASDDECRQGYACGVTGQCELVGTPCTSDAQCADQDWTTNDFCVVVCGHATREGELATGDVDGDGIPNASDLCPETADPDQNDDDGDGQGNLCDNCVGIGGVERCNGRDDDCDGQTDEGFGVGASCASDELCRIGVRTCNATGATDCPASDDAPAGLECGAATCVGSDLRLASRCNGAGRCSAGTLLSCQGFRCVARPDGAACTEDCAANEDCAAGYHCAQTPNGGACAPDLGNGAPCGGDFQCASEMCIDGVCCATDCAGGCFTCSSAANPGQCVPVPSNTDPKAACGACGTCNAAGQCANVAAGPSPKGACPVEPPCGGIGLCDATGHCRVAAAGSACDGPSCFNGTLTAGTTCDGQGGCRDATSSPCPGDLLCAEGNVCLQRCASDRDCRVGNFCDATGACLDLKARGQTCSADRMCASGICADGLCCDSRCTGLCESCATGAAPGTCSAHATGSDPEEDCGECGACSARACVPHADGTDPDNDCELRGPCLQNGQCDGSFGCAAAATSVGCGDSACIGTTLIAARFCDGQGSCANPSITACSAYTCDDAGGACRTSCASDAHCQGGFFCTSGGACVAKQPRGATCTSGAGCTSGFCSDNRCCDTACAGVCETCAGDNAGTCSALDGVSDGACAGELVCKAGACKRRNGASCGVDGDCADGHCVGNTCCDKACTGVCQTCGSGLCTAVTNAQNPGLCDQGSWCNAAQECKPITGSICTAGVGCPEGRVCKSGQCKLPAGLGTLCESDIECASGQCTDGYCCESECLGTCRACNVSGRCVNLPAGTEGTGDCPAAAETCGPDGTCKKAPGEQCIEGGECANVRCVDGKCCPTLCDGVCETCASGTCQGVVGEDDPGTCESPSLCFASGQCKADTGTACVSNGDCASSVCLHINAQLGYCCDTVCDGACESCAAGTVGQCTDILLAENGERCRGANWCNAAGQCVAKIGGSCGSDADCAAGTFCNGSPGTCEALRVDGATCGANGACRSGHCIDERCCESACAGACESCDQVGALGRCDPVPTGTDDGSCGPGELCSRAAGGCALAPGQTCSADAQCASGYCADSVCCERACSGLCEACGVGGLCATVVDGESARCGGDFACGADGVCGLAAGRPCGAGGDCASDVCGPSGVCCASGCEGLCERCETDGLCTEGLTLQENPGRCDGPKWCLGGACVDKDNPCSTGDDSGCAPDYYCAGGACAPDLPLGASCTPDDENNTAAECRSGFCSGNTCCESACHGICEACHVAGFEGQCVPAPEGEDPNELCGPGLACNGPADGSCGIEDGEGCVDDFECVSGRCDGGVCCHVACDGVCERCADDGLSCQPVLGGDDEGTCVAPRGCFGGACLLGLGERCDTAGDCASGACADATVGPGFVGVCCDDACGDACRNCDPFSGVCQSLVRQDDPDCAPTSTMWCDKHGDCALEVGSPCGSDSDCPMQFYCSDLARCEKQLTPGETCTAANQCDRGFCSNNRCCMMPCDGPCDTCDPGGVCRTDAVGTAGECVGGRLCDGMGQCALPLGSDCNNGFECATGACVAVPGAGKSVCCQSMCEGLCEACSLDGTCGAVTSGPDEMCNAPFECDGRNRCLLTLGQACGLGASCASGFCVDDVCCSESCGDGSHCDAAGQCALDSVAGALCVRPSECGTGLCENGRCCQSACLPCQYCSSNGAFCEVSQANGTTPDCRDGFVCDATAMCVQGP